MKRILYSLFFLILTPSYGWSNVELKFENLEEILKTKNKKFEASKLELRGAKKRLGYLKRSFIPTADASLGMEKYQTGPYENMSDPTYSVRLNLNLYKGGRDRLEEDSRKAQEEIVKVQTEQVLQSELFELKELYWNLVYLREIDELYQKTISQNKINLKKAETRINAGLATSTDRLEFEISETQLQQDITRISVSMAQTQRKIAAILGMEPETKFVTMLSIPHHHNEETPNLTMDLARFRDVRFELATKKELEAQGKIAKRWWTPSLDIYAESILYNFRERDYFTEKDRIDNALGIQLSFSFDGFQSQYDGEALIAQSLAAQKRSEQIKLEAEASFNTAKQELTLLHDLIHEGEKNVEKGAKYLKQTQDEYSRGVKNSLDVLSATIKQLEFKKRFAELRKDHEVAKAQVQLLMTKDI